MASLNRIILVGRLTADAEGKAALEGLALVKFRLAVDRPQGGADFIDVVAWGKVAEAICDSLKKGRLVLAEGRIQIRAFEDHAGQRRWATEVVAKTVTLLDGKVPAMAAKPAAMESEESVEEDPDLSSDLPF